ncbi:unnamed protein product [Natator depressus]
MLHKRGSLCAHFFPPVSSVLSVAQLPLAESPQPPPRALPSAPCPEPAPAPPWPWLLPRWDGPRLPLPSPSRPACQAWAVGLGCSNMAPFPRPGRWPLRGSQAPGFSCIARVIAPLSRDGREQPLPGPSAAPLCPAVPEPARPSVTWGAGVLSPLGSTSSELAPGSGEWLAQGGRGQGFSPLTGPGSRGPPFARDQKSVLFEEQHQYSQSLRDLNPGGAGGAEMGPRVVAGAGGAGGRGGRFLPEERAALADWQRELYWAVRKEKYELVTSLGSAGTAVEVAWKADKDEEPNVRAPQGSGDGRLGCSESPSRALCRGWSVCLGSSGLQGPPALGTGVRDAERPATSGGSAAPKPESSCELE